jgi:hypothetical protein
LIPTIINQVCDWFRKEPASSICLQCDLPSGGQFMVATDEPIMHPHHCSWCSSVLYVPGPMFCCKACAGRVEEGNAAQTHCG